jgi:hypothetical protein
MKIWIIMASLAAACATFLWLNYSSVSGRKTVHQTVRHLSKSLFVGLGLYFTIMALALVYLMIVTP